MRDTEDHCHCDRPREGSDHCMWCGCEEFERVCDEVWVPWLDDHWHADE